MAFSLLTSPPEMLSAPAYGPVAGVWRQASIFAGLRVWGAVFAVLWIAHIVSTFMSYRRTRFVVGGGVVASGAWLAGWVVGIWTGVTTGTTGIGPYVLALAAHLAVFIEPPVNPVSVARRMRG